ncbi:MAG: dephospho-CoA kinase [Bacteroidia bacterium]|nr:MAG: dephospho-CoA kinase [Bacteroidia bacterium]
MKIICITGGIGSGKTTVAKIFETLGYPVYYSDERAKAMYFLPEVKRQIIQILGKDAYINENTLNKKYIADRIFADSQLLNQVNQIIHSAVKQDFQEFLKEHADSDFLFKESALIFEAQLQTACHKIILVTAPREIRVQRIKQRDKLSDDEIIKRMSKQMPDEEKIKQVDFVIHNNETEPLLPKVLEIFIHLKNSY